MSGLWNPYAFSVTGVPLAQPTPPSLRFYSDTEPTKEQLLMAQHTFARFCETSRLSFVPNPVQQGELPDGAKYRITVVANTPIMQVWPVDEAVDGMAFSGILFWPAKLVLVNKGGANTPSGSWALKDVSGLPMEDGLGTSGPKASYNPFARLTVSRDVAGSGNYLYSTGDTVGRYAHLLAYVARYDGEIIAIAENKRLYYLSGVGDSKLQVHRSDVLDLSGLFPAFGSPLRPTPLTINTHEREILYENTGDDVYRTGDQKISKNGKAIAFTVNEYTPIDNATEYDAVDNEVTFPTTHGMYAAVSGSGSIQTVRNAGGNYYFTSRNDVSYLKQSSFDGENFSAPVTIDTFDGGKAVPDTTFRAFSPTTPSKIRYLRENTMGVVTGIKYPRAVVSSVSRRPAPSTVFNASMYGSGPIGRKIARDESSRDLVTFDFTGAETLVPIVAESTMEYRIVEEGTYTSYSDGMGYGPSYPNVGDVDSSYDAVYLEGSVLSATVVVNLQEATTYDLGGGRKLLMREHIYEEHSSLYYATEVDFLLYGYAYPKAKTEQSISFTLNKKERVLKAFDPALDLLCYTEVISVVSNTGSTEAETLWGDTVKESTMSGGGALPTPPTPYLVIECKGTTIRIALPFFYASAIGYPDDETKAIRTLYPNTGIAPGVAAGPYTFASSSQTKTSDGFAGVGVGYTNKAGLTVYPPPSDPVNLKLTTLRGLSPPISFPHPKVTYTKTPITGGGYMTVFLDQGSTQIRKQYVIDSTGIREAANVVPTIPLVTGLASDSGVTF